MGQNLLLTIRKAEIVYRGSGKGHRRIAADIFYHRLLLQKIQHPVACGEGVLQGGTQSGQGDAGAKGAHQGEGGNESSRKPAACGRRIQHGKIKQQDHGVGDCAVAAGDPLGLFLLPGQLCAPLLQFLPAGLALSVLQGLGEPAQAVQHKAGELAALAADLLPHISAPAGGQPGDQNSHHAMGEKRKDAQDRVIAPQKYSDQRRIQRRNADGGDGVGVEHLQQFNVRGDDTDEVPFVLALKLGGAQAAQDVKDAIPQQGQQLEGDKVVAGLFPIAQCAPQQGTKADQQEQHRQGKMLFRTQRTQ